VADAVLALETKGEERKRNGCIVMSMRAISIMYHDVVDADAYDTSGFPGADAALYKLERDQFEQHLKAIAGAVAGKPAMVSELSRGTGNVMPVLLTFDDGGESAYTHIAGALERADWRGHFFITAGYVDTPSFVTRAQIHELHQRGHVIGTHSLSHPMRMSHCSWDEMLREWHSSVEVLSEIIGERVRVASVPGGHFSRRVAESASEAGIETLFTSEPTTRSFRVGNCLVVGRYTIQRWMPPRVVANLAAGKRAPRARQMALWNAKKVTKALGGDYYLKVRKSLLRYNRDTGRIDE
jgi:peptidoglycan/xylan/chitin deacetylase (PgdA/CDA1 family)